MVDRDKLRKDIQKAWSCVAPFWPLKNLVSTNPLLGFIDRSFKDGLAESLFMLDSKGVSNSVYAANQQTIQWCQLFFDQGQATISMPY